MDWIKLVPYIGFLMVILWGWEALAKRARARRQRLTTVAARFGLFVSWIATGMALVLVGLGTYGFYNAPSPINENTWFISGGLCAVAFVVWLLGRGLYFVLAGSLPEEPQRSEATAPVQFQNPLNVRATVPLAGPRERKAPPRP
jgi:hypothetical protein